MAAPMHDIARQLSETLEQNNDLLGEIGQLENQQLAFQKAVQEKQTQLRQALQVADSARAESNDLRRKLAVAQDVANKVSEEAKSARVENGALKRQVESLDKSLGEAKRESAALKEAKSALSNEVETFAKENRALARDLDEASTEADERISALMQQNAYLTKDLGDQRARQAPMHAELDSLRAALVKAVEDVEVAKKGRAEAAARAERAVSAASERDASLREAKAAEARAGRAAEEEKARCSAAEQRIASLLESCSAKDAEVAHAVSREGAVSSALQASQDEASGLRREAEALAAEVLAVSRARATEAEEYESRLRSALDDLRRIADEARGREASHAADATRHAEQLIAARRDAEEAIEAAQADTDALAAVLEKERADAASCARVWEEARASLERGVAEASRQAAAADTGKDKQIAALRASLESSRAECGGLKDELLRRGESYLSSLSSLQAALREVGAELTSVRQEEQANEGRVHRLAGRVEEAVGAGGQAPLDAWYEEARRTFSLLGERVQAERRRADGERDNTRAAEVAAEELRGRVLMLEEGLSRVEHEAVSKGALLKEAMATAAGREESSAKELRAAASVAAELQGEVVRLRDKADKGSKARIALQTELAKAQAELADSNARNVSRVASLEEQVGAMQSSVSVLTSQVDALGDTAAKLHITVEQQAGALETLKREKAAVMADAEKAAEAAKAGLSSYAGQVSALSDGMRAMEKQLKSTQGLLSVVKEQKTALAEANVALRAELDGIYSSSLQGAMAGTDNE